MIVEVKRSKKRSKTISARIKDGNMILHIPDRFTISEEKFWIEKMKQKLLRIRDEKESLEQEKLDYIVRELNKRYLNEDVYPKSIKYSSKQKRLFGSCSVKKRIIRISDRVKRFPDWVIYYIVFHELVHLIHPDHSKSFWNLVRKYPLTEKALGFLIGYSYGCIEKRTRK